MAVLGTQQEDPNNPNGGGGSSAFAGGGTGQGATTTASPAPTSSGSYTNLQSYLNANGVGQAGGADSAMGGKIADQVGQAGQATDTAMNSYSAAGAADAHKGTATVDPSQLSTINNSYNSVTGNYSGPTSAPATTYTGLNDPTKVQGYGDAQTAYGNLQGMLNNVNGGAGGVSTLLKGAYSQPGYTSGENTLDTAMVTGGAGGQAALTGINNQWGGEGQRWSDAQGGVAAAQKAGQDASTAAGKTYADAIAAQQAKAAAWKPSLGPGGGPAIKALKPDAPAPTAAPTFVSAPAANAAGVSGVSSGGGGGSYQPIDKAGPANGSRPIITPPAAPTSTGQAYQGVVNQLQSSAPTQQNWQKAKNHYGIG